MSEEGKKTYTYKHWGTVDESDKFHPNANFFYESPANRRKLIFPSDWDLCEATGLTAKKPRGRVAYEADDVDRQYGTTWFLDRVAETTGIRKDLLQVFDGNTEIVDDILTMAHTGRDEDYTLHRTQRQTEIRDTIRRPASGNLQGFRF